MYLPAYASRSQPVFRVGDVDHRGDRGALRGGAELVGPVLLAALLVAPAPRDHLHRRRTAPVGAGLLGDLVVAEDPGAGRVVGERLPRRGRGVLAVRGRGRGGSRRGAGADLRVPGQEPVRQGDALDLVAQQPHLGHRPGGLGELGAVGLLAGGRAEGGALAELGGQRQVAGLLAVRRSRALGGRALRQLGDHLVLGGVGPAGVEAVALALEVGAAHLAADQGGRPEAGAGGRARRRTALGEDRVDLLAHGRGDGARAGGGVGERHPGRGGGLEGRRRVAVGQERGAQQDQCERADGDRAAAGAGGGETWGRPVSSRAWRATLSTTIPRIVNRLTSHNCITSATRR